MIKIAFVIDTIESPTAGTEKQLLALIRHLDRDRFTPYLCVLRPSPWLRDRFRDCRLVDIGVPSFARATSYLNIWRFAGFLRNEGIDVVQTHFVDGNKVGIVAARAAGVRAVVSTRRNQGYWHNAWEKAALKALNPSVTAFLANSHDTSRWAARVEGIEPGRLRVIHNALDLQSFTAVAERSALRRELGLPENVPVVGVVANLRPVKGLEVFLAAAKRVLAAVPEARFVVIGEGSERQTLMELSQRLGVAGSVSFLGRRHDIPSLLGALDVGVLSSHSESFSNAVVEYMGAGLPVVCTDVGGAREAVTHGENGFIVPAGDHQALAERIIEVITGGRMTSMGAESRRAAEARFSVASIVAQHQDLYAELAGES